LAAADLPDAVAAAVVAVATDVLWAKFTDARTAVVVVTVVAGVVGCLAAAEEAMS